MSPNKGANVLNLSHNSKQNSPSNVDSNNNENLLVPVTTSSVQQQNSIANRCSSVHSTSCTPPPPPTMKPMLQRNQSINQMSPSISQQHHQLNTHQQNNTNNDIRSASASPAVFNNRTLTPTPTNLVNNSNHNSDSLSHTCKRPRLTLNQDDDIVNKIWVASNHS